MNAPSAAELAAGVRAGNRAVIARAITIVESTRTDHRLIATELVAELLRDRPAQESPAIRVGITGVPGVGKSTSIDALGMHLIRAGHRVAVLAVDPSSSRTGGSILGDKTRMAELAVQSAAFIRPSPTAGTLGGVARATRETMVVLESAGYDVILVETVGVGQSETTVANMVDTFAVLALARTGDSLQGIKKGILELADLVVVNKADGKHLVEAQSAARELRGALHLLYAHETGWTPPVLTMSAIENVGVDRWWETVLDHVRAKRADGTFTRRRQQQQVAWMWAMVDEQLRRRFADDPHVGELRGPLAGQVESGQVSAAAAADALMAAFDRRRHPGS